MSSMSTYQEILPCLICETPNSDGQTLCRHCSAPMDLVRNTLVQGREPRMITILGDSNVGKTVFLGFLLDMLSQRTGLFDAVPRGAHSVDLPQNVISHMAWRMFPPKTPMEANQWNWAYYEVCRRGKPTKLIDLVTPDLPGEAIAAEVASPTTFKIIHELLRKSSGLMLLADAAAAAHGSTQPDFFALKILSYVDSCSDLRKDGRINTPVAVVLTKADYVPECFDDPRQFAQANLNRLWNMCDRRCTKVEFFASSVVGSLGFATRGEEEGVTAVPLHTALRGILEPFEWIVEQV